MKNLGKIIYSFKDELRKEETKAVFWQEKNNWCCSVFILERNGSLFDTDKSLLNAIKKVDNNAVVLHCEAYVGKDVETLVRHVISDVNHYHQKGTGSHNINAFLERYDVKTVEEHKAMTKNDFIQCLEQELQKLTQATQDISLNFEQRCMLSKQIFTIASYLLEKRIQNEI